MIHLELLHHFTTSTSATLSPHTVMRNLWRVNITQVAFQHEYVLHGMLALAAIHMSRFKQDRKAFYLAQGTQHHDDSLSLALPLFSNPAQADIPPLYMFSILTFLFALARPRRSTDLLLIENGGLPEWLLLFRGTRSIIQQEADIIRNSPMAAMLQLGESALNSYSDLPSSNEGLQQLETWIKTCDENVDSKTVLLGALDSLQLSYSMVHASGSNADPTGIIFLWIYSISDQYLKLLQDKSPEALCVFAFFCVLLRRLEYNWWMEGWANHIMESIYASLNDTYRIWIRWAIEEIGFVPSVAPG